jgi:hypothetical protein
MSRAAPDDTDTGTFVTELLRYEGVDDVDGGVHEAIWSYDTKCGHIDVFCRECHDRNVFSCEAAINLQAPPELWAAVQARGFAVPGWALTDPKTTMTQRYGDHRQLSQPVATDGGAAGSGLEDADPEMANANSDMDDEPLVHDYVGKTAHVVAAQSSLHPTTNG